MKADAKNGQSCNDGLLTLLDQLESESLDDIVLIDSPDFFSTQYINVTIDYPDLLEFDF